jgi:peptidoglycan/xylan/chitin deacetylase (PgdA/CDA1 family)
MEILDRHGIRATLAIDAASAERCPAVIEGAQRRRWEFLCAGHAASRALSSRMSPAEERDYIRTALEQVAHHTGVRPRGWIGPEYSESTRTPALLAAAGVQYLCDWPNDEQPYQFIVPTGRLVSLPVLLDADDVVSHAVRHVPIMRYAKLLIEALDRLKVDGARSSRLMIVNLHPWLMGQPFRAKYLDEALGTMTPDPNVWSATTGEVAEWYLKHEPSREQARPDRRIRSERPPGRSAARHRHGP